MLNTLEVSHQIRKIKSGYPYDIKILKKVLFNVVIMSNMVTRNL